MGMAGENGLALLSQAGGLLAGGKWPSMAEGGFVERGPCYELGAKEQVTRAALQRRLWM
jgi:hypothetical protein